MKVKVESIMTMLLSIRDALCLKTQCAVIADADDSFKKTDVWPIKLPQKREEVLSLCHMVLPGYPSAGQWLARQS